MTTGIELYDRDRTHLTDLHGAYNKMKNRSSLSAAAASFLIIGALIVIGSASLCVTIPGVNVITQVVIPGIVPGSVALIWSTPCVYGAALHKVLANERRRALIDFNLALLEYYQVGQMEKEEAELFIAKEFFEARSWTNEYIGQMITDIKDRLPDVDKEDDNDPTKPLVEALDGAKTLMDKKKEI